MMRGTGRRWLPILGGVTVMVCLCPLAACQSEADEDAFLKHAERRFDRSQSQSLSDEQWWQTNRDRILSAGWASCEWLESRPEIHEGQGPREWELSRQYLRGTDALHSLSSRQPFRKTVVANAWAYLCSDTRNSRTSLPAGAYKD